MTEKIHSTLGFVGGLATIVGLTIGGGLWASPAVAGAIAGPGVIVLALLVWVPVVLAYPVYSTLSRAWPVSAAHYYYVTHYLFPNRPRASQLVGWTFAWNMLAIGGFVYLQYMVVGAADFLNILYPSVSVRIFTALLLISSFIAVWFGLRVVGRIETVLAAALLFVIGLFLAVGLPAVSVERLTPLAPNGPTSLIGAYAILFALGAGTVASIDIGGEVEDAETAISKFILLGAVANISTATLVSLVTVGLADYTELQGETVGYVAQQYLPGYTIVVIAIGAVLAGVTTNMSSLVLFNRYFEMATDEGILPSWIGRENSHGEPKYLLAAMFLAAMVFVYLGVDLGAMATSFAFGFLFLILLIAIVGIRLPSKSPEVFEQSTVQRSRVCTPAVVRFASIGLLVLLLLVIALTAAGRPVAFGWYCASTVLGLVIYGLRWYQTDEGHLHPDSGQRPIPSSDD
jgi:APA family basic amino acid/polyamine antiporter